MAKIERHERPRANWLTAHSPGWHLANRRKADQLERIASSKYRADNGLGASSHHAARIKWLGTRFVTRGGNPKEQMARVVALGIALLLLTVIIGPAWLVSSLLYWVSTEYLLLRKKVPSQWPWLVAAGLVAAGGTAWWMLTGAQPAWGYRGVVLVIYASTFSVFWIWSQGWLALLFTAWHVRRNGWPGVKLPDAGGKKTALPSFNTDKKTEAATEAALPAFPTADKDRAEAEELPAFPSAAAKTGAVTEDESAEHEEALPAFPTAADNDDETESTEDDEPMPVWADDANLAGSAIGDDAIGLPYEEEQELITQD